jgi:phospholipid transport system transporter-binding protein
MSQAMLSEAGDGRWRLGGVLDFGSVPEVWPTMERQLKSGGELSVSLAEVSATNSAGLVMLIEARDLARRVDCRLTLTDLPDEMLDLARLSGCEGLLTAQAA